MRITFLLFSFFIYKIGFSQQTLVIHQTGIANNQYPELMVGGFSDTAYKKINDSTVIFSAKVTDHECLFIAIDKKTRWFIRIWIYPETKLKHITINYNTQSISSKDEWDLITEKSLRYEQDQKFNLSDSIAFEYIKANPKSYFSLWLLSHGLYRNDREKKITAFKTLSVSLNIYPEYKQMESDIWGRRQVKIGDPFKEFDLADIKNNNFQSKSVSNKWILLIFWSNGCGPCIKELDELGKLYKTIDSKKIEFISVSLDEKKEVWSNSKHLKKINWPSVWQKDNFYGELCLYYNVLAIPFFVLFDNERKIYCIRDGANELESIKNIILEKGTIKGEK